MVIRAINTQILSFKDLSLPSEVLENLCNEKRGLVLVTGTTGSGKSTTVASMIEYINKNMSKHILTLEDPIEYLFQDKRSMISQREIRIDTESFHRALEYSMLQTPDIIFIGDIRTADVMSIALTAAVFVVEGHYVIKACAFKGRNRPRACGRGPDPHSYHSGSHERRQDS
jgi:twitching motility protein PilT